MGSKNGYTGCMNKIFAVALLSVSTLSFSFAQVAEGDFNNNGIRDDVDSVITQLVSGYSLTPPQASAINQVARSQQYILSANPQNRSQAIEIAKRDTAATNCAGSRLPGTLMDIVYTRVQDATFNTVQRQAANDYYASLLGEDDNFTPVVVAACEDSFSTPTPQVNNYTSGQTQSVGSYSSSPSGIISDQNISNSCTVMTQFMEYGSRASQVLTLQKFLSDNGYMEMWPTGYFGRNTEAAVRLWQSRHGVDVRGYVGPNTRASIADITCRGDSASIQRAVRGVVSTYVAPKASPKKVIVQSEPVVVAQPSPVVAQTPAYSSARLSAPSGTFYTARNPVNALYFTFRTNTAEQTMMCLEMGGANNCANPDNFITLQSQYRPGTYDTIPNGDRWILNFYYSPTQWANGGKVYLKSASGIPDVYTVNVSGSQ